MPPSSKASKCKSGSRPMLRLEYLCNQPNHRKKSRMQLSQISPWSPHSFRFLSMKWGHLLSRIGFCRPYCHPQTPPSLILKIRFIIWRRAFQLLSTEIRCKMGPHIQNELLTALAHQLQANQETHKTLQKMVLWIRSLIYVSWPKTWNSLNLLYRTLNNSQRFPLQISRRCSNWFTTS